MKKSLLSAILLTLLASASVATAQIQMTFSIVQPTCHGNSNGSATVFAVGGAGAYTYLWSNSQATQTTFGIGVGTYTVTVTDAALSTASGEITVSEPSAVIAAITASNLSCDGKSGTLTATGFGGTPPYTYAWDGPGGLSSTESVTVVDPGSYFVTVTDANHCSGVGSFSVASALSLEVTATDILCASAPNSGSASAVATGSVTPYVYSWSNGGSTALLSGLGAGPHICTVTSANGCVAIDSDYVDIPSPLELKVIWHTYSCGGNDNGTAIVEASGGTAPYSYSWTGGLTGPSQTGLAPGEYFVTVTDANLCQKQLSLIIADRITLDVQLAVTSATCVGIDNATATAVVDPVGGNYMYEWTVVAPDSVVTHFTGVAQLTHLAAGSIVTVTVTDPVWGCSGTATGTVGAHTNIHVAVTDVDIHCAGGFGSAIAVASNGTPQYTYTWYSDTIQIGNTPSIDSLLAGAYWVSVEDALGCKAKAVADIGIESAPHAMIEGGHVLVCGDSLSVVQFINHSTDQYNVITNLSWTVTGPTIDTVINQQNQITFQLPVNETITVQLIATSGLGCSDTATLVYNVPGYPDITLSIDSTTLVCTSDSVSLNVLNGDSTYTYVWNPAVTLNPNPLHVLVSPTAPTTYVLTTTDGHACTAVDSISVSPSDGFFQLFVSETTIQTCSDSAVLFAYTSVPTTIIWSQGGVPLVGNPVTVPATPNTTIYTVSAFASDSCFLTKEVSVTGYNVVVTLDPNADHSICEGYPLPLSVLVSPLSDSLEYQWSVNAPGVLSNPNSSNPMLTGPAGIYTVTVIVTNVICADTVSFPVEILPSVDLGGHILADLCNGLSVHFFNYNGIIGSWDFGDSSATSTAVDPVHVYNLAGSYHVVFSPTSLQCTLPWDSTIQVQTAPLAASITEHYLECADQATIQFNGTTNNTGQFSWAWIFSSGTPDSSSLQNPVISFTQEGIILASLLVQDVNGCLDTVSLPVNVDIIHESIPNIAPICPGDTVQLNPDGFQAGADYHWTSVPPDPSLLDPGNPNPSVVPLVPTVYTVEVKHGLCTVIYSVSVSFKPGGQVALPGDMVVCSSDSVSITAQSNGATFEWSTSPVFTPVFATTQTVKVLPPGTFYVRTTGAVCTAMDSVHIGISLPEVHIPLVTDIVCAGDFGSATAVASNGTPQYTYSWYSNGVQIGNSDSITGLLPGAYLVSVVDSVGCTAQATADIKILSDPNALTDGGHVLICGDSLSTVQFINLSADTYNTITTLVWTVTGAGIDTVINQQDTLIFQLPVDETITLQLIATSSLGCSDTTTLTYNVPGYPQITLSLDSTSINCNGDPVSISVINGDPTYEYGWDPAVTPNPDQTHVSVSPTVTTTYVLTATDGHACTATTSITVGPILDPLSLTVTDSLIQTCNDSVTLFASTNIAASILWSQGGIPLIGNPITVPATPLTTIYTVTALTANNCLKTEAVSVTGYGVNLSLDPNAVSSVCEGSPLPLSVIATPPSGFHYLWSVNPPATISDPNAANPILNGPAGVYTVGVTVSNGPNAICSDSLKFPVEILPAIDLNGHISIDLCNGLNVHFFNNSLTGGSWDFGDGSPLSTEIDPVHIYNNAGEYHVVFSASLPCTAPWDSLIIVHSVPLQAHITHLFVDCVDEAKIQFSGATNYGEADMISWNWMFPGGTPATSTLQNPIVVYTQEDTIKATLVVRDINGCLDTADLFVILHIINDTIPNAIAICPGDSVQLNPGGHDFGANYHWISVPVDSTLNPNDPNPTVMPQVPTLYSVEIKEGLCSVLYTVDVTFNPGSNVHIVPDTASTICAMDLWTLTAQGSNSSGFEWSSSSNFTPIFDTAQIVHVLPNGTYFVRTSGAACVASDSITINLQIPEIQIVPTDSSICQGEQTTLILTNLIPDQMLHYSWNPALTDLPNQIISPTETTTYSVTVTNQFGCTASLVFPTVNVTTASVIASVSPDTVSYGHPTTTLVATPGGNGTVITYAWTPPDDLSHPNAAETEASPKHTQVYTVTVTTEDGCVATDSVMVHFRESACVWPFIFIPKAFTPNGDDKNDRFIVRADGMTAVKMIIWNRWGEIVFETTDVNDPGWDGTYKGKSPTPDSYAWYVWLTCGDGETYESKGNVTLLK